MLHKGMSGSNNKLNINFLKAIQHMRTLGVIIWRLQIVIFLTDGVVGYA